MQQPSTSSSSSSSNIVTPKREMYDSLVETWRAKSQMVKLLPASDVTEVDIRSLAPELSELRDIAQEVMLSDTALFYTDKLITLAKDDETKCKAEVYRWAKMLHEKGEYHRAAFTLTSRTSYHIKDLSCRHLAAKCYFDAKSYQRALDILLLPIEPDCCFDESEGTLAEWQSSIELLKGYTYEAMDNRLFANKCFIEAFRLDIYCYEAFAALIRFDIITPVEEKQLMAIIEAGQDDKIVEYIKHFYSKEMNKYDTPNSTTLAKIDEDDEVEDDAAQVTNRLAQCSLERDEIVGSLDVQLLNAEKLYENCEYRQCYNIVNQIYSQNSFQSKCVLLLISCLMELDMVVPLQLLSHKLVEIYPEHPISWYAVGCYYYQLSNSDQARKYFAKSTSIDAKFQPSMLMFGHTFEMDSLHDQAMAVYLDLSKAMPRSFLPLLYVGVEYCHMNNTILAERYLKQALQSSHNDLFVLHELGIAHYQKGDYSLAKETFQKVYDCLAAAHLMLRFPVKWEPLLNNLGHVCRKLGDYKMAIDYHERARVMIPGNASTYDSIGLCYSLLGELKMACDWFQKALAFKRDDAFAITMYEIVYQQYIDEQEKENKMDGEGEEDTNDNDNNDNNGNDDDDDDDDDNDDNQRNKQLERKRQTSVTIEEENSMDFD